MSFNSSKKHRFRPNLFSRLAGTIVGLFVGLGTGLWHHLGDYYSYVNSYVDKLSSNIFRAMVVIFLLPLLLVIMVTSLAVTIVENIIKGATGGLRAFFSLGYRNDYPFTANNIKKFNDAIMENDLDGLNKLNNEAPREVFAMIHNDSFIMAASNNHPQVLEWLDLHKPDVMAKDLYLKILAGAAEHNNLAVLEWMKNKVPFDTGVSYDEIYKNIIFYALSQSNVALLQWLVDQLPEDGLKICKDAAIYASKKGDPSLLSWSINENLRIKFYGRDTIGGDLTFMKVIIENAASQPLTLDWMMRSIPSALKSELLDHLSAKVRNRTISFYHTDSDELTHLATLLAWVKTNIPERIYDFVPILYQEYTFPDYSRHRTFGDNLFDLASRGRNNNRPLREILLTMPDYLNYAEEHVQEYNHVIDPYVRKKLVALRTEHDIFISENPNAIFNVNDQMKCKCYFYMLKRVIRNCHPANNDLIRFLLDIPSVRELAHTAIFAHSESNELLRLALNTRNQPAADLLLRIDAVRDLAVRDNFYRGARGRQMDLAAIAQNKESSMRALSNSEARQLESAREHYQSMLQSAGQTEIIQTLRDELSSRYQSNPATIKRDGDDIILPESWNEFIKLDLTPEEHDQALIAYYKNTAHTAIRYLSRPNQWMANNASFVIINDSHTERWSTFEEYYPEISLFWLAAVDKTMPAIDGHTYEGRIDHFISELAHIGRAHNWDRTRVNAQGNKEQYDDLEGDKPSCYSGVKRRLFQSVIGHPLFMLLTKENLDTEIREFVRNHFISKITDENKQLIADTLENYTYELEIDEKDSGTKYLSTLDITKEQENEFIKYLSEKYGSQFSDEPRFKAHVLKELKLEYDPKKPNTYAHALKCNGMIGLANLVAPKPAATDTKTSTIGFYAPDQQTKPTTDTPTPPKRPE